MRIAAHITDRTLFTWPAEYWSELVKDILDKGHQLFVFTDDKNVNIDFKHKMCHVYNGAPQDLVDSVMSQCEVFIGVPLKFSNIAKKHKLKMINLLGSTSNGSGITSPLACQGCIDKCNSEIDCIFHDELCYWRITPIMVNKELDALCA